MRSALFILISISLIFSAEKIYDVDSASYEVGGYRSYPEFINNMPGVKDSTLEIKADPDSYDPTDPNYQLFHVSKKGRTRPYRDALWGFCDGEKLYIRVKGESLFGDNFREITLNKFYSYYTEWYSVSAMAETEYHSV